MTDLFSTYLYQGLEKFIKITMLIQMFVALRMVMSVLLFTRLTNSHGQVRTSLLQKDLHGRPHRW